MSAQTERLEREAETTRLRLSATINELRGRMTPGQVLDEITGYTRGGWTGDFVRNLGHDLARNPVATALAGAGLAWLMLARNGRFDGGNTRDYSAEGAETTSAGEAAGDFAEGVIEQAADAAGNVSRRAAAMRDSVTEMAANARESAESAYHTAQERAHDVRSQLARSGRRVDSEVKDLGRSAAELCREQPLLLAGVGIALGALVGALLPSTEAEDRVVGPAADEVKDRSAALASESYETASTLGKATSKSEPTPMREGERMPTGNELGLT